MANIGDALTAFVPSADYEADIAATKVYKEKNPGVAEQISDDLHDDIVARAGKTLSGWEIRRRIAQLSIGISHDREAGQAFAENVVK